VYSPVLSLSSPSYRISHLPLTGWMKFIRVLSVQIALFVFSRPTLSRTKFAHGNLTTHSTTESESFLWSVKMSLSRKSTSVSRASTGSSSALPTMNSKPQWNCYSTHSMTISDMQSTTPSSFAHRWSGKRQTTKSPFCCVETILCVLVTGSLPQRLVKNQSPQHYISLTSLLRKNNRLRLHAVAWSHCSLRSSLLSVLSGLLGVFSSSLLCFPTFSFTSLPVPIKLWIDVFSGCIIVFCLFLRESHPVRHPVTKNMFV